MIWSLIKMVNSSQIYFNLKFWCCPIKPAVERRVNLKHNYNPQHCASTKTMVWSAQQTTLIKLIKSSQVSQSRSSLVSNKLLCTASKQFVHLWSVHSQLFVRLGRHLLISTISCSISSQLSSYFSTIPEFHTTLQLRRLFPRNLVSARCFAAALYIRPIFTAWNVGIPFKFLSKRSRAPYLECFPLFGLESDT